MSIRNNNAWFADQVQRQTDAMFRASYAILRNESDCQDAASAAILTAYTRLYQLRDRTRFRAWLMAILRNECYRLLRERKRFVPLDEDTMQGSADVSASLDLQRAFQALSADSRMAITLYYTEGYTVDEIAEILQVPAGTIKSRLSRARSQMRQTMTCMGVNEHVQ